MRNYGTCRYCRKEINKLWCDCRKSFIPDNATHNPPYRLGATDTEMLNAWMRLPDSERRGEIDGPNCQLLLQRKEPKKMKVLFAKVSLKLLVFYNRMVK